MGYDLFTVQEPGQPETWSCPGLNNDLSLRWESIDGQVIGPISATAISEMITDGRRNKFVKVCGIEDTEIYCYITESRFVFVCPKYDKGGGWSGGGLDPVGALTGITAAAVANAVSKRRAAHRSSGTALVGQIRHPWVWCVQFWQKTGWGTNETVRLYYRHSGPERPSQYAEIVLSNSVDAADIAYRLTQSIVRYRLSDRDTTDEQARTELNNLLAAGPAKIAARGEPTDYDIPGDYFVAGGGEKFAPLYPPSSGQNVPLLGPPPPASEDDTRVSQRQEQNQGPGIISVHEPNEPEDFSYPTLNDDLSIRFDALDGEIIGPITATSVTDFVFYDQRDAWLDDDQIFVFLTEARLVYLCPTYNTTAGASPAGRKAVAGQLRYPWISLLEFTPKQNWVTKKTLRLFYHDDGTHIFHVTLDKKEDAAVLARALVQRIAAYQLAASNPKDQETIQKLQDLRATDHLPTPGMLDYTSVSIPVSSRMGSGQEHAPGDAPSRLLGNHAGGP